MSRECPYTPRQVNDLLASGKIPWRLDEIQPTSIMLDESSADSCTSYPAHLINPSAKMVADFKAKYPRLADRGWNAILQVYSDGLGQRFVRVM
jgi:hypothetical protein